MIWVRTARLLLETPRVVASWFATVLPVEDDDDVSAVVVATLTLLTVSAKNNSGCRQKRGEKRRIK